MSTSVRRATVVHAILLTAACGTVDAPDPLEPTGPTGRIRFVNVITDTTRGRVNAILEGVPFGVNLTYTQTTPATLPAPSTAPYAAVLAGSRTLILKRTADTNTIVATLALNLNANADHSVYAIGGTAGSTVTAFVTTDTNATPDAGQARVRVVQLSPTAGAVDVFVTAPGADLATATPRLTALGYRAVSGYFSLPAATYQIRAVPAGTAPALRAANVTVNVASLAVPAAANRTIVAADNTTGGAPLRGFVLVDR